MTEINEATALNPNKFYIVDADTDEPLDPPHNTSLDAQRKADSKQWGDKRKVAVKQGKDVKWQPGKKEAPMIKTSKPSVGPSSTGGKPNSVVNPQVKEEALDEAHELVTPMMTGTPEERLEALNLWTGIVTSLKKISELPSNENKVSLLRAVQREAQCVSDRVLNVVHVPTAAAHESQEQPVAEDLIVLEEFPCTVTADRLSELAGVTTRKLV